MKVSYVLLYLEPFLTFTPKYTEAALMTGIR